jgi:hypothetical protein
VGVPTTKSDRIKVSIGRHHQRAAYGSAYSRKTPRGLPNTRKTSGKAWVLFLFVLKATKQWKQHKTHFPQHN